MPAASCSPDRMFRSSVVEKRWQTRHGSGPAILITPHPVAPSSQVMMNRVAYQRARESLQRGHQVMVFVHARKDTVRTAEVKMCAASFKGGWLSPPFSFWCCSRCCFRFSSCRCCWCRCAVSFFFGARGVLLQFSPLLVLLLLLLLLLSWLILLLLMLFITSYHKDESFGRA